MQITKYCLKCHTRKTGREFYKSSHTTDGLAGYCKDCSKKVARDYLLTHPDKKIKYRENAKGKYSDKRKEWSKEYRQRPEVIAKRKARESTDEYKRKAHERYLKSREKRLAYAKKYREENLEKVAEIQKNYRIKNADKIREKRNLYVKTSPTAKAQRARYKQRRLERDSLFAMKERMRKTMSDSFLRRGYKKDSPTSEILGCDWETLCKHLFNTWEQNYGSVYAGEDYHIDHIIPLSTAKTEADVKKLCNYKNLQLLKPQDNLSKSNSI